MASVIPAIVLAAGRSSRMGRAKATLPAGDGHTFLTRIVRTFLDAGVDDVIVVVGHDADAIAAQLFRRAACRARFVVNREYDRGQLSSLLAGLNVVDRPGRRGGARHARRRAARVGGDRARGDRRAIAERARRSCGRPPAIATAIRCSSIARCSPRCAPPISSTGAKPIVRAHASAAGDIAIDDEGAFTDIDTEEEYRKTIGVRFGGGGEPVR